MVSTWAIMSSSLSHLFISFSPLRSIQLVHLIKKMHSPKGVVFYSSRKTREASSNLRESLESIRNVGIMAHIDAGKTTTTERILFCSGFTRYLGEVDDGDTVMDYMKQERERGITINSAAITFDWKGYKLNLIDTPGHIDFTFEVERVLRVLDGAVALLDGAAGVQVQTTCVWEQANSYGIPRIAFINKMDKQHACCYKAVESMENKFHQTPILIQYPLGKGKEFSGVVDLVSLTVYIWEGKYDDSKTVAFPLKYEGISELSQFLEENKDIAMDSVLNEVFTARQKMIDQLAMHDDSVLEVVMTDGYQPLLLNESAITDSLRRVTCEGIAVPVLMGSSLRNVGVTLLIDAIANYLPSPSDRVIDLPDSLKSFYAFAFKVIHDKSRGPLVFLRIYSGSVTPSTLLYNATQDKTERVSKVLLALADEYKEMKVMSEGNIAVVAGLKHTMTGDTLVLSKELKDDVLSSVNKLKAPVIPQPMFFCTIEPDSSGQQEDLDHALSCITREDPSLRVSYDSESGQTVLSGMGELHLEVTLDRIINEYKISARLGELQIAYRESPTLTVKESDHVKRVHKNQVQEINVELTLSPSSVSGSEPVVDIHTSPLSDEIRGAITNGVKLACTHGPIFSYPVIQVQVSIDSISISPNATLPAISSVISQCVSKAMKVAGMQLLEPFMKLEIKVPNSYLSPVLSELTGHRRGIVSDVRDDDNDSKQLSVSVPLSSLKGYSTKLRSITSGTGSFVSQFSHYEPVPERIRNKIGSESFYNDFDA
ncbi:PREDICTED: ribosome-releasing factor 2, mitochondrial-like isoform X2 [Amphimedon queenslandica]|uniref:Tr-type G domain-containing protein n=1 Tax=Amphimedon queenslandica TaxID=400682 RepID=A0A1X7UDJ9_AMPQE|nr:PREDICTED: ribosome-releasing factor 2, mitochondrial-like isoform X2 [Amphimedon queenslandica]|eukprot:XP_019855014.1 PREDICTED: ribosome-releasing factor 2, mitochondrial-like isoform X2 [Amphimedon queenslandica]